MSRLAKRSLKRTLRHRRIRRKVVGIKERPRLCVFRSHKELYAQVVDDISGRTLIGCSTRDKHLKDKVKQGPPVMVAEALGKFFAAEVAKQKINEIVFDRGGYSYHGRVKAFAEALRAGGIRF